MAKLPAARPPRPPFQNPNVLQASAADISIENANPSVSIRCPHCLELGQFDVVGSREILYHKKLVTPTQMGLKVAPLRLGVRICPNSKCRGFVLVVTSNNDVEKVMPAETLDFTVNGLPRRCARTLEEAIVCHAAGAYRSAAIMVRRLLEEICDESGAEGKDLHHRLADLRTKVILPPMLFDAMDKLKLLGNDATHVRARVFDDIREREAAIAIKLAKEIVKALYQLGDLVAELDALAADRID